MRIYHLLGGHVVVGNMSTEQKLYAYRVSCWDFSIARYELDRMTKSMVFPKYHSPERNSSSSHRWFGDFHSARKFAKAQGESKICNLEKEIKRIKANLHQADEHKCNDADALRRDMPNGPLIL